MELSQLLLGLAVLGVILAVYWSLTLFMRKRFVILYHSKALDEVVVELRRIAAALERAHPDPVQQAQLDGQHGQRNVLNSMFGR